MCVVCEITSLLSSLPSLKWCYVYHSKIICNGNGIDKVNGGRSRQSQITKPKEKNCLQNKIMFLISPKTGKSSCDGASKQASAPAQNCTPSPWNTRHTAWVKKWYVSFITLKGANVELVDVSTVLCHCSECIVNNCSSIILLSTYGKSMRSTVNPVIKDNLQYFKE